MAQEFHPFPERTRSIMEKAQERRAEEAPDPNTGRKPSAYKAAMEAKRARFNQSQGHGQAEAPPHARPPMAEAPLIYDVGTTPQMAPPSAPPVHPMHQHPHHHQHPHLAHAGHQEQPAVQAAPPAVDRSRPLGPQLMAAVRNQQGLRSNLMAQAPLHSPSPDPERTKPVSAPPDYVAPVADGRGTSLSLPSNFAYYPFKDFYVLPIRGNQLEKFADASETDSYVPVVEAVASLSYSTGKTGMVTYDSQGNAHEIPPAYFLTPQDFMNVLYHLRLHNFTRSKYIHSALCENKAHIAAVDAGQLRPETLQIESYVEKTHLKVIHLTSIPDPFEFPLATPDLYLKSPQMIDVLEVLDMKPGSAGEAMLIDMACYFQSSTGVYLSVADRVAILRDMNLDDIEVIRDYMNSTDEAYGVDETINITCTECGTSRKDQMSLDVHSFLPHQ